MELLSKKWAPWIILLLGVLFYFPFLGGVHLFDWDEINFAEISREMIVLDDYLRIHINYEPFWEKPPLFFWLQSLSMKAFGITDFAARFPNAVCGVITLITLYWLGKKLFSHQFGLLWMLMYFGSFLPHLYFKSGIIDPYFNLFIFLAVFCLFVFRQKKYLKEASSFKGGAKRYLFLGALFLGLAVLTKGPVAVLILLLAAGVLWVRNRFRPLLAFRDLIFFTIVSAGTVCIWFGIETLKNGTWFIAEFTKYQYRLLSTPDAGHKGFFGYHVVVLFLGCFPASIFALKGLIERPKNAKKMDLPFRSWMSALFWVVLVLFSIVQSKIVHYSSLCYFPLTFFAAQAIYDIQNKRSWLKTWVFVPLVFVGTLLALAVGLLPYLGKNIALIKPLLSKDPFAQASLSLTVPWTGWESIAGLFYLFVLLFALLNFKANFIRRGVPILFLGSALFLTVSLWLCLGKIESYSQRPAIEFYKAIRGEDAYVTTIGFKSYAHLYYFRKPAPENPKSTDKEWLLTGPIDKPAYFVLKAGQERKIEAYRDLVFIGSKGGFVFYKRVPQTAN